ncbi:MAG: [protein-PII] uridylyltransferase [Wenzhouxiangellaceae bacterium]|nr:[protein-PII] uridylyltransferase [Wenzhouxiangellaceae bacterium]
MIDRLLAPPASRNCLDLNLLQALVETPGELSVELGKSRRHADEVLAAAFRAGTDIRELVQARAWVIEQLVLTAWHALIPNDSGLELIAVGGFGRGELHPHSDADLLILYPEGGGQVAALEDFVRVLWDADLHPGHGVRSVSECVEQAAADVSVATNLMESRLLDGAGLLFEAMREHTQAPALWPADEFFAAKFQEQQQRHDQFEDTVYNLEPDIKNGPGGLRDIQMIAWVTRRHFGTSTLHGLVEHDFLSERELEELVAARNRLWSIRWALHEISDRAEERLLFDYQRKLAATFGFDQADGNEAVEAFMQRYYRTVMRVERLNEQLLQIFEEELLAGRKHLPSATIDKNFRLHHGYLELIDEQAFVRQPELLLRVFLVLADNEQISGVRASTIRLIREHLYLIDEAFRNRVENLDLFLRLLRRKRRVYSQLERMNRYGILAALIPSFGRITGRMQFDLFHVYTVDQHILFVIRNLRRIAVGRNADRFAHAIEVFGRIERPEVLYLAGLFHDIAKGRAGDHSELGADDARAFMDRLDMPEADRALVVWLVEQHLLMSMTAQRQDISDPAVIDRFSRAVGTQRRLDHLFVLTVADIAATRPKLWNSWKDSLLWELFTASSACLKEGLHEPLDRDELVEGLRGQAFELLVANGREPAVVDALLARIPHAALLRLDADQLAWTAACVLDDDRVPLVSCRNLEHKGITETFVFAEDFDGLFAVTAREFDRMELNVLAARIATTQDGHSWDLFQLMDANSRALNDYDTVRLERALTRQLGKRDIRPLPGRPIPRRLRHFMTRSEIVFESGAEATRLEIATTDRPGLLSAIAEALLAADARLHDARVATFGQRVEDVFVITGKGGGALDAQHAENLERALRKRLDP